MTKNILRGGGKSNCSHSWYTKATKALLTPQLQSEGVVSLLVQSIFKLFLMFVRQLPIVTVFLNDLSDSLSSIKPSSKLTKIQKLALGAMLIGIIVTENLNWAAFERRSLGMFKSTQLCWIFYSAKIAWEQMLAASILNIISAYQLTGGYLAIDDTQKRRAKKTKAISGAHKIKDKATGGYINGQELVFMVFINGKITVPVGFKFYVPDPKLAEWSKLDTQLKRKGIAKKDRPKRPIPDHVHYPTKQGLALEMLKDFTQWFPDIKIKSVLADALYGTGEFMDKASRITKQAQIVSQLRTDQIVASKNSKVRVDVYFRRQKGIEVQLAIRGGEPKKVTMLAARLYVKAHGKRRFVIALKYEGEEDYRYLVASDMSWHHHDIAKVYTLRWLIEVFIQDWKAHDGWNKLSKQQGEEGSRRGLILSLLCEHLLLLHPEQFTRLKNNQPGMPAGCIIERLKVETVIDTVKEVVSANDPETEFNQFVLALKDSLPTRDSSRHMAGRELGKLEATESLKSHAKNFRIWIMPHNCQLGKTAESSYRSFLCCGDNKKSHNMGRCYRHSLPLITTPTGRGFNFLINSVAGNMKIIPIFAQAGVTGFESPAAEYTQLGLSLDELLVEHPNATFIGMAKGDSMEGVGIFDNDILIVDRHVIPQHLDVIVANFNGEFVCKIIDKYQRHLLSANDKYQEIAINSYDTFCIEGVVARSIRCHRPSAILRNCP